MTRVSDGGGTSGAGSLATVTVLGRLRHTRHVSLFVLAVLLTLTMFVVEFFVVKREFASGDLGFDIQRISSLEARIGFYDATRWPDLKTGDTVVAVNDRVLDGRSFFLVRTELTEGPISLRVRRASSEFTVSGTVGPRPMSALLAIALRWITGALIFLLGIGAFILRPGTRVAWVFLWFAVGLGSLLTVSEGFSTDPLMVYWIFATLFAFTPVLGLHWFSIFPTESPRLLKIARVLYVGAAAWWLFRVLTPIFEPQLQTIGDTVTRLFAAVTGLALLVHLGREWRSAAASGQRRLSSLNGNFFVAALIGLVAPIILNVAVRLLGWDGGIGHQLSAMMVLFFFVVTTATLVRHNPLEIDRYSASVVGYVVTLGALGGVFAFALVMLPLSLKRLGLGDRTDVVMAATAIAVLAASPGYRWLRGYANRWFSREQADALQTASLLRGVGDVVQQRPREEALREVVNAALVIGAEGASLWQVDAAGEQFVQVAGALAPASTPSPASASAVARSDSLSAQLSKAGGVSALAPVSLPDAAQQVIWSLGLAMTAPVRAHSVLVGFLGVGRRASGFGYRREDLAYLELLAVQAGLAIERGDLVTQIGRYRVEKRLAAGGMAEVFVAWQLGLGGFERKVALKRLLPEIAEDPRSAAGLLDEARITARLQHRNIAQVYEVGLEAGQHFIAMEFVDGPPLRSLIAAQRRASETTPISVALGIAQGLLAALHHAHELTDPNGVLLNVVHRDVTPSNVLVSKRGEAKLVDFGLVHASNKLFKTATGVARGTLPFMSPEQVLHTAIDRRADVYSAAATLYELFTGVRAFTGDPMGPMPQAAALQRPELNSAIDVVFERAYAQRADDRYPDARAFFEALAQACQPVAPASEPEIAAWVAHCLALPVVEMPRAEVATKDLGNP